MSGGERRDRAACAGTDPEAFFPPVGASNRLALRVCAACPVRRPCLADAVDDEARLGGKEAYGIRGGKTGKGRLPLVSRRRAELKAAGVLKPRGQGGRRR